MKGVDRLGDTFGNLGVRGLPVIVVGPRAPEIEDQPGPPRAELEPGVST